jgi:hypothetical protein
VGHAASILTFGGKAPIEIEAGHEDEGIKYLVKSYVPFCDIEGLEVELLVVLTTAECLAFSVKLQLLSGNHAIEG